jgi:hypothetical protein
MEQWQNDIDREKLKDLERTCPSVTLFTTNPTWTDLGMNPGLPSDKQLSE